LKKIFFAIFIAIFAFLSLSACSNTEPLRENSYFAMDTLITIKTPGETDSLADECYRLTLDIENKISKTIPESDVYRFNSAASHLSGISDVTAEIIKKSLDASEITGGAFDVTVEPIVSLWKVTDGGSVPSESEIKKALEYVGSQNITLDGSTLYKTSEEVGIDLGGVGKGYALGACTEHLTESGVEYGIVSFGGNIGVIGNKPDGSRWTVGIKDPRNTDDVIGYIYPQSGDFVAVSGDYERYFEKDGNRYHHLIDPKNGYPAEGVMSVAVIADDAVTADILSTALFVLGYESSMELYRSGVYDFEAVFCTSDGIKLTDNIEFDIKG